MTTLDAFAFAGRWDAAALPPATPGGSFRSLLLWPSNGDGWILGRWDGENWCDDEGLIISPPKAWAPLPPVPDSREDGPTDAENAERIVPPRQLAVRGSQAPAPLA
jgi:hypothetical protein